MRRLVIFASFLGVGVCVDSGGGGAVMGAGTLGLLVERVGGVACARQVTWRSRGSRGSGVGGRGFAGLWENRICSSVSLAGGEWAV